MNSRKIRMKRAIVEGNYKFLFVLFFVGFYILNIFLNKTYVFYSNISSVEKYFSISFILINFLLAFLFSLAINLIILKFRETRRFDKSASSVGTIGFVGAIIGGGCPSCFVGVLPAIIAFFGLGISFADYPYLGLGIQIFSGLILLFSVYLLSADPVCKIPSKRE